jgi:Large-conductance mechanosensitive channel, MscL
MQLDQPGQPVLNPGQWRAHPVPGLHNSRPHPGPGQIWRTRNTSRQPEALVVVSGFKNFIIRGNLVRLAVAVVIGTQFSDLVKQFVQSFINPLLSLAGGRPDFGSLAFKVGRANLHLWRVPDRRPVIPDRRPGRLLRHGAAGKPADPAVRAQPGGDRAGLSGVHDEHPGAGAAMPGVHRGDRARH